MVPECKPEWSREAITVFSKLPSLMAADKPFLTAVYNQEQLILPYNLCTKQGNSSKRCTFIMARSAQYLNVVPTSKRRKTMDWACYFTALLGLSQRRTLTEFAIVLSRLPESGPPTALK